MTEVAHELLFVDDDPDLLRLVSEYLREEGFGVTIATDSEQALWALDQKKINLVILDLNLAGEDGLEFMKVMKSVHQGVPILVFTGMEHSPEQINSMKANGAAGYVQKGLGTLQLADAVRRVLSP